MNEYHWEKISENKYKLHMEIDMFKHHRINETNGKIKWFDPGGGPVICLGRIVEKNRYITKIEIANEEISVEVK